jgi:tRNA-specific 2-thiouridylase
VKRGKTRVAMGLSGGVDSSVAMALLKEQGYDVAGLSMEIFDSAVDLRSSGKQTCYGPEEKEHINSAAAICRELGIPFYVIDLKKDFTRHVIENFRLEYLNGRTPNPCILCNRLIKFGLLPEKARKSGINFDLFGTGHYARIVESNGRFLLKRPMDVSKDQTYFLYGLAPEQLSRTIFPLGDYGKEEVRDIARSLGLNASDSPESQDFITGNDYGSLFKPGEIKNGNIVNEKGDILGRHRGIIYYTVGQRKGLGISSPRPLYVKSIDAENNRIVVSDKGALFSKGLIASNLNLIPIDKLDKPGRARVKIRLQHEGAQATISPYGKDGAKVVFDEPQISVTPGQSAVFYVDDTVLGGGIIKRSL